MAAPTLLDYAASTWTDTTTGNEVTADVDWASAGDIIIVLGATEDNSRSLNTPTATGLTFAALTGTPTNTGSSCKGYAWSATAAGNGNSVVTAGNDGSSAGRGLAAWAWAGSNGLGTPVVDVSSAITSNVTVAADSSVVMVLADWNATADTTVTTVPAGGTIRQATAHGNATFLVIEWNNQAAGTRAYGVSAWTGTGTVTKIAVEVQGTAGGSTPISGTDTGTGTDAATLSATLTGSDTGAGTDAGSVARAGTAADTGAGTDAGSVATSNTRADTGTGTDASTLTVALTAGDTGAFTDAGSVSTGTPIGGDDAGGGTDTATVTVYITASDSADGVDTSAVQTPTVAQLYFTPPTLDEGLETVHPLFRYYRLKRGVTVLVSGATVSQVRYPEQAALDDYDYVYLGGRIHPVSDAEVAILTAAGYAAYITEG